MWMYHIVSPNSPQAPVHQAPLISSIDFSDRSPNRRAREHIITRLAVDTIYIQGIYLIYTDCIRYRIYASYNDYTCLGSRVMPGLYDPHQLSLGVEILISKINVDYHYFQARPHLLRMMVSGMNLRRNFTTHLLLPKQRTVTDPSKKPLH